MRPTDAPEISIVVPLFNEQENIQPLVRATKAALEPAGLWEMILVDDGSTDGTADVARGSIVVSMDGDLQNDPADIPRLVRTLRDGDYDLVAGYRAERQDAWHRRLSPGARSW